MAVHRSVDGTDPVRSTASATRLAPRRHRQLAGSWVLASGSLACPACDAPVAPDAPHAPADALGCPFCGHAGAVRDFLSLAKPQRPARVDVRIAYRARLRAGSS
jgi:hypothetical protein